MNIQQYTESDRQTYAEFASCVAKVLESALSNAGQIGGIQQVQHRAKEVDSLSRKLKDRNNYHSDTVEVDIKDLAGCRLIFYHNDDLNTFLHSSIVSENFDVDWDESKIHHPDSDAQSANDFYMGNHFVVTLKSDRTGLPEFAKFAGLRCEIQAQTLLNHAWSETIHNITYKKRGSEGFGDRAMTQIDERLMSIMKDYLRPAGYEFQKVKHDLTQLEAGREIFDKDINQAISQIQNTNDLHDLLERYKDYVLPNYTDYASFSDEIYSVVEASLERARQLGVSPIETPFGSFDGKDYTEILSISLDILGFVRYLDFDRTLALLGEICKTHVEPAEQDVISDCALSVAGFNDDVLRQYGYVVQQKLVDALSRKSDEELLEINRYVLASCEAILTPNIEKTEWTHDQVTFGKINLPGSAELAGIRSKALKLLERLAKTGDHTTKQSAFSCMEQATRTPSMGNYDDELLQIILNDTNSVIHIYMEDIDRLDFEMMQANEERISFHYRRSLQLLAKGTKPREIIDSAEATANVVRNFRDKASGVPNYERYKVLVGFRSIFEKEWDDEQWGLREKEKYRDEQIDAFVDSISDENIDGWIDFFAICVKADSSDLATFQYFSKFLRLFAQEKPELAKEALENGRSGLDRFLVSILLGLADAGRIDLLEKITESYIAAGEHLWECTRPFALVPLTCRAVLHKAKDRALELENRPALYEVMLAVIVNHDSNGDELDQLFLPAIEKLTELSDAGWINEAWFKKESIQFLKALDRNTAKKVLDNLISLKELDYHAEALIEPIAENYPDLVLAFFGARLDVENEKERDKRYDAIPYEFQKLGTPLSAHPELVVESVFSWFKKSPELFEYRGANLVSITFPEFDEKLEDELIQLVKTTNEVEIRLVNSILRNYKGETFLHSVCREIVIAVNGSGPLSREVEIILEESGVLHGEFGFVERCKRKKEEIEYWLSDTEPVVREFAEKYIRGLERQRAAEQRRAEEELALRKLDYD